MHRRLTISTKLLGTIGVVALVAALAVGWFALSDAKRAFRAQAIGQLETVRGSRAKAVTQHFARIHADLRVVSKLLVTRQSLRDLRLGFHGGQPTADYARGHALFDPIAKELVKAFGFHDVLLISTDGVVLYTAAGEIAVGSDLRGAALASSPPGDAFLRAAGARQDDVSFIDYRPYAPSRNAPAAFVSTPVFDADGGSRLGVVAFQMSTNALDAIMADSAGLGQSGDAYLLGPDLVMRTRSRLDADTAAHPKVETEAARRAASGDSGTIEQMGRRGKQVIASFAPLRIEGATWSIVTATDVDELLAPVRGFGGRVVLLMAIVSALAAGILSVSLRRMVLEPVKRLARGAERVAQRRYDQPVKLESHDELGLLGRAFDGMMTSVASQVGELERGQKLLEAAPDAMVVIDNGGTIRIVNHASERLFGYAREELIGQNVELLVPDAIAGRHVAHRDGYMAQPTTRSMGSGRDLLGRRKDGSLVPVEISLSPLETPDGLLVVAAVRDISDRRAAALALAAERERLQASEQRLEAAASGANLGLWDARLDTDVILVNEIFERQLGYERQALRDGDAKWAPLRGGLSGWPELVHPDDRVRVTEAIQRQLGGESELYRAEHRVRCGDGSYKWILSVGRTSERGADGRPTGVVGVHIDINAMKDLQSALETARDAAEAATQAKSDFLANMSHEIRTPMNAIMGMTHLALQTELTDQQADYLVKTHNAAEALLGVINDILDFSKIEAGMLEIEQVDFSLDETLDSVANLIGGKAQQKGIELLFDRAPDVPVALRGDPLRLGQILVNLGNNAVKFTEGGEIVLSVRIDSRTDDGVRLRFSVRDTGIGMTAEQVGRLFRAFSQADTSTTRRYGGTGLGLSICRSLTTLMAGDISVTSEPGVGSEFVVTLPFQLGEQKLQRLTPHPDLRDMRVLVTDDNETSRFILKGMLEGMGYDVELAPSGTDALARLDTARQRQQPFELMLLDWKMPGLDGFQTLDELRADRARYGAPRVVMITAYGREEVMRRARAAQLDGFLIKPLTQSTLFDSIMAAFGKRSARRSLTGLRAVRTDGVDGIRGARVLLAEDNEINRQVAREILQRAGLVVIDVNDGSQAVETVQRERYDAVLMDIQMPVLDGLEATRRVREWEMASGTNATPIIAMTAHAMAKDVEKSLAAGMNDHVTKPIDPAQLLAALVRHIAPRDDGDAVPATPAQGTQVATADATLPDALPGIDLADGLGRLGGNTKLYRDILLRLSADFRDAAAQAEALLDAGDQDGARRVAHSLKGVAGNVGAVTLHDVAAIAEDALAHGEASAARAAVRAMEGPLREVIDGLSVLGTLPDAGTNGELSAASVARLSPDLRQRFVRAATRANMDELLALADELSAIDGDAAGAVRAMVDGFEYDRLATMMRAE
jgi:PAS domain S-box-containing protein